MKNQFSKTEMSLKMRDLAQSLPAGSARAQAYNISTKIKEMRGTIAEMMQDDHVSPHHARRHCYLLERAGLAEESTPAKRGTYGVITFCDGSTL